jgi:hypothetical protein
MTDRDLALNVTRLRAEAAAKLDYADALEVWDRARHAA